MSLGKRRLRRFIRDGAQRFASSGVNARIASAWTGPASSSFRIELTCRWRSITALPFKCARHDDDAEMRLSALARMTDHGHMASVFG